MEKSKNKLRWRDLINRWYTWVFAIVIWLFKVIFYWDYEKTLGEFVTYYVQVNDTIALSCLNEFPGLWGAPSSYEVVAIFGVSLIQSILILAIIYTLFNYFGRKQKIK